MEGSRQNYLGYKKYEISADKNWVIFLHGIGGNARTFSFQLKAFKPHFNLLFPDLRGHGRSKNMVPPESGKYSFDYVAKDILNLMDHLGIDRAHFVGCSFGVSIIRVLQELRPDKFISIVASGAVIRLKFSVYSVIYLGKLLAPLFINPAYLYMVIAYIIMPRKNHSKSRQMFIDSSMLIDKKEYIAWLSILTEVKHKLDALFSKPFKAPTLLVMGAEDHAFLKDTIRFSNTNKETELKIIQKCGHLSSIEKYTEFNSMALSFFLNKD